MMHTQNLHIDADDAVGAQHAILSPSQVPVLTIAIDRNAANVRVYGHGSDQVSLFLPADPDAAWRVLDAIIDGAVALKRSIADRVAIDVKATTGVG